MNYCISKAALNMLVLHLQQAEDIESNKITYWTISPGHTKTGFNNFQGKKDPLESAKVFVKLLFSKQGEIEPGTFWEYEEETLRIVPW